MRFIALTDHFDSLCADAGESGIVLPVKNFINDSYCRDISTKVKSQFDVKRKNGEYIASFAVYGYRKAADNKNRLVVDEYAAEIVKKIYAWKIDGMANSAIAERLNQLSVLSPKEYKKSIGVNYNGGFSGTAKPLWSSIAVKRILTNEVYLGHLVQGKTEKVNYKLKKWIRKPQEEWIKVENTHEAIISEDDFEIVQNLLKADGRISPITEGNSLFMGILYCGDCKEQMVRRTVHYKDVKKMYYICSTKNRGEGCSRHSILEEDLKEIVEKAVMDYANLFLEKRKVFEKSREMETNMESVLCFNAELVRLKQEKERYDSLCSGLFADLSAGVVTREEFERLHGAFQRKAAEFEEAQKKQEDLIKEVLKNGVISAGRLKRIQECAELREIDRHTLCSMVKQVLVFEGHRVEIEFYYMDHYRMMCEICGEGKKGLDEIRSVGRGA